MVTYEVLSPVGALVHTFDCPTAARKWVFAQKLRLPDLRIERVEITTTRAAIYTPRKRNAA